MADGYHFEQLKAAIVAEHRNANRNPAVKK